MNNYRKLDQREKLIDKVCKALKRGPLTHFQIGQVLGYPKASIAKVMSRNKELFEEVGKSSYFENYAIVFKLRETKCK